MKTRENKRGDQREGRSIHQFHIVPLWENIGGTGFHFTNSALFMVLTVVVATLFFVWASAPRAIVPGRLQSIAELAYEFVAKC